MTYTPTSLKLAIVLSGQRQFVIAKKASIHESRFSNIVNGHLEANERERAAIARVLRKPVEELFPEVAA